MTPGFRYSLLWIASSLLAVVAALSMLTAAHSQGEFLPSNGDAFYHARRILDSVFSGNPVIQFDDRIHVPEGSWLTWPWGFDTLMATITRLFGPFASVADANRILMNIPPAAAPIALALVVTIARQLALPFFLAALLALAFAALPLVFQKFAVGNVDHHFAEQLWTLATMSAGIRFFRAGPPAPGAGIVLGCVLGTAMAIHNGLFILQIPVSLTLGFFWLRGIPLPARRQMISFSAALLVTTLLVCIPSEPWRRGFFEFYTLSWFHFYIAACVSLFAVLLAVLPRSKRNVAIVVAGAVCALVPIVGMLTLASEFISGQLESISTIVEAKSPYVLYQQYGEAMSTRYISWLLWLTGPMLLLNLWWAWRLRDTAQQFVALASALGLALFQMQYRLSVFGELPMLLTPLLAASLAAKSRAEWRRPAMAACAVLLAVSLYPTLASWHRQWTLGGAYAYPNVRAAFPELKRLCAARPGVVLGNLDTGHWVRYHSDCSVIADVFLLTPQHAAKVIESERLLALTPAGLLADKNPVRYVFAHHTTNLFLDEKQVEGPDLDQLRTRLPALEAELLGPEPSLPPQFVQRWEERTPAGQVYARLYEVVRIP